MKQPINEIKRMQQLAGLLKETALEEDNRPKLQQAIDAVLATDVNSKLDTYIKPVKFILDQGFAEDAAIDDLEIEVKQEMEYQLGRADNKVRNTGDISDEMNYKNLRLIFAKIEAILGNA